MLFKHSSIKKVINSLPKTWGVEYFFLIKEMGK